MFAHKLEKRDQKSGMIAGSGRKKGALQQIVAQMKGK